MRADGAAEARLAWNAGANERCPKAVIRGLSNSNGWPIVVGRSNNETFGVERTVVVCQAPRERFLRTAGAPQPPQGKGNWLSVNWQRITFPQVWVKEVVQTGTMARHNTQKRQNCCDTHSPFKRNPLVQAQRGR